MNQRDAADDADKAGAIAITASGRTEVETMVIMMRSALMHMQLWRRWRVRAPGVAGFGQPAREAARSGEGAARGAFEVSDWGRDPVPESIRARSAIFAT